MSKATIRSGLQFGLTSGVITTLGLMVGLYSGTHSVLAVTGGIISVAIADAFSDALGMHIAVESAGTHSHREIWEATAATFLAKVVFALSFILPVLLFDLRTAIFAGVLWGLTLLTVASYKLARGQNTKPAGVIAEHLFIATAVVLLSHFVGRWIAATFGSL